MKNKITIEYEGDEEMKEFVEGLVIKFTDTILHVTKMQGEFNAEQNRSQEMQSEIYSLQSVVKEKDREVGALVSRVAHLSVDLERVARLSGHPVPKCPDDDEPSETTPSDTPPSEDPPATEEPKSEDPDQQD